MQDYGRKVCLLLAVGAIVTTLVGVLAGWYGFKHSAVPWEAQHTDTTKRELSLGVHAQELSKSQKPTDSEETIVESTINPGG